MKESKDAIEIEPKTLVVIIIFIVIVLSVLHNIKIFPVVDLPDFSRNKQLSYRIRVSGEGSILENEVFNRIDSTAVLNEFYNICRKMYKNKDVTVFDSLMKAEIIADAGMELRSYENGIYSSVRTDKKPMMSLFYNPLVFSAVKYKKTSRYPIRTAPEFKIRYPNTILFFEAEKDSRITIRIENDYVIAGPEKL